MDINTSLKNIVQQYSPTKNEISQASTSQNYIREYLLNKSKENEFFQIDETFLTGSYARYTKIKPLNDVDMFIVLNPVGLSLDIFDNAKLVMRGDSYFKHYLDSNGLLSSLKILNVLEAVVRSRYPESTKVSRDNQVINVFLKSYGIGLDLVPAVHVNTLFGSYYLIPMGGGKTGWQKTNPKKDASMVSSLNKQYSDNFRDITRLAKIWNVKCNASLLRSFHIESIAIQIFNTNLFPLLSTYTLEKGLKLFFNSADSYLINCPDHTGISSGVRSKLNRDEIVSVKAELGKARYLINNSHESFIAYLKNGR